ncbi:hypothetical protein GWG65_29745 [Bradyrhizobium sp. CSA207]|uniref:hypothetical protein n=1 Tax=Bradyrhizobium sp. CSA207 TaxID=2698826 RepID=UPI0023B059B6|nr:hypothetical protein [Bradyrhizobium sp. CSA207]MDE5445536.1 hypothetical protein [Bradyrhizobium sp. CSA207]
MKRIVLAAAVALASLAHCGGANGDECKDAVGALERYGNKVYERGIKAINDAPKLQGSGLEYYQAQCALKKGFFDEARESLKLNKIRSTACNYTKDKVDYWNKVFEEEVTQNQKEMDENCSQAEEIKKREAGKKR